MKPQMGFIKRLGVTFGYRLFHVFENTFELFKLFRGDSLMGELGGESFKGCPYRKIVFNILAGDSSDEGTLSGNDDYQTAFLEFSESLSQW